MKGRKILLALISGLLLWLSWNPNGLPFLIFFAFVPLLVISDMLISEEHKHSSGLAFCYGIIAFLIWNVGTTWWIFNSTGPGAIVTFILNSSFMALVYSLWHFCRRRGIPEWLQPVTLISFWMSFEFLHLNWDLTWPWLNLGNVFDSCTQYTSGASPCR